MEKKFGLVSRDQNKGDKGRLNGGRGGLKENKRRAKAKKEATNLFDSKEQHPIIEFKPEEDSSASLTPSFVLEVCLC